VIDGAIRGLRGIDGRFIDAIGFYLDDPTTALCGGGGGEAFTDPVLTWEPAIQAIASITIGADRYVDSIQITYLLADGSRYAAPRHGGDGGKLHPIVFRDGEHIIAVSGNCGDFVNQIGFTTQDGNGETRVYGPYGGGGGGQVFDVVGDVIGFFGRCGRYVDAIAAYLVPNGR